jgi:hypothetical protein
MILFTCFAIVMDRPTKKHKYTQTTHEAKKNTYIYAGVDISLKSVGLRETAVVAATLPAPTNACAW